MASRNHNAAAPQLHHHNRAGVPALGKTKAVPARPDALNRRPPLGDIGNLVSVRPATGNPQEQVNRPITRSFGAQLVKKAQAKAAIKNAAILPARHAPRQERKAPVKQHPPPEDIIVLSSDSEQSRAQSESSASSVRSRRKAINTLSSVLSARSKAACGIAGKPRQVVDDIDKLDVNNELAVVEYIEDIYTFYKIAQHERRPCDYIDAQLEINSKMRAILADWIIEVHHKFELMPETLYLTMYIIDQYLSLQPVLRKELQLVGVSSMLIACKYEEIWAPEVNDFILISDSAYSREQILSMEKGILNRLEWNLTVPTVYMFLVRFLKAATLGGKVEKEMENMVFFFAELALMQYDLVTRLPSLVAASAVYAARLTLKRAPLWTDTLKHHTGFRESEAELIECTKMLVIAHSTAPESKLRVVYKKYSSEQFGGVALRPPAEEICK
ncbi:cyclin IaZm [Zea mays]|uniref:Cyclin-B1-4 n=1 Tax=Zea mays TaxID=4577 RepID=B4G1T1_MAIZE|nr:cyclin IaZm [Zea mays]ACF88324.1 unknown [Zea mays]ACN28990.1 unknown [Zea mays]ONM37155.1 Cyclin-B1-4 [Zea mays]|eukprot:NP_001149933.1 cyclin IaZm [Zea mays]